MILPANDIFLFFFPRERDKYLGLIDKRARSGTHVFNASCLKTRTRFSLAFKRGKRRSLHCMLGDECGGFHGDALCIQRNLILS